MFYLPFFMLQDISLYMSEVNPIADLTAIFNEIDKDHDGFISRVDLEESGYALSLFQNNQQVLSVFYTLSDKMNQQDFALLANAYTYKLQDLAIMKFEATKILGKYLSAPQAGEAGPIIIKQSYINLLAHNESFLNSKEQKIGFEMGVDRVKQEQKIKGLTQALGHAPHEVFLLFKLKTNNNGQQLAAKLQTILSDVVQMLKGLAPQFQLHINTFKIQSRYHEGYINIVIEVENAFLDGIIKFFNEIIQSISPDFCLKFRSQVKSNLKSLLSESFDYQKSGGYIDLSLDIDSVTLKKIKTILSDNVGEAFQTQQSLLFALLLEEIKFSAKFDNLAEAVTTLTNTSPENVPKPNNFLGMIKQMNLKQTIGQIFEQGPQLIDRIKENCQFQGEISLNLRDIFVKILFDVQIEGAFDLL